MRKILLHSIVFFILLGSFFISHEVFAEEGANRGIVVNWLFEGLRAILLGILNIFAWMLGLVGFVLNYAISNLVIGMGGLVLTGGFGGAIDLLWKVLRDLVNLTFVFALIYVGIMTIVQGSMHGLKKGLASVIVAALLVNFSLFFTKVVIDASNIVADSIYRKMLSTTESRQPSRGISAAFMANMGMTTLMAGGSDQHQQARISGIAENNSGSLSNLIVFVIGSSVFMFLLAIAFGLGAFLLITRFITLIVLMITSPLAFLPKGVPFLGDYSKKWWTTLFGQAFLAPVYLFGLYLSLIILQYGLNYTATRGSPDGMAGVFVEGTFAQAVPNILFFFIAIALIIGTTKMAKDMSKAGASRTTQMMGWAGKAVGTSLGATGYMGRMTIGRVANNNKRIQNSLAGLKNIQADKNRWAITRGLARVGAGGITSVQKSSFDARANGLVGKFAKGMDLDVGKASKENYDSWLKGKKQEEADYARSLNVKDTPEMTEQKALLKRDTDALHIAEIELKNANKAGDKDAVAAAKMKVDGYKESVGDIRAEIVKKETANQASYAQIVKDRGWFSRLVAGHNEKEGGAIEKAIKEDIEKQKKSAKKGEEYKPPEKKAKEKSGGDAKPKDDHKPAAAAEHKDDHGGGDHGGGGH